MTTTRRMKTAKRTTTDPLRLLVAGLAFAWAPFASAEEAGTVCEDARVRIQGRPDGRWLEPIVRACEALRAVRDLDDTARVRIVPAGNDLIVEVALADGRSTMRRVRDPGRLQITLEALLAVPPAPAAAPPAISPADAPVANEPPIVPETEKPAHAEPHPASFGVEIGGSAGGRVAGAGYFSFAPAGFGQLRAGDWLFGMSARWDVVQGKEDVAVSNFEMETLAAGLAVARRFRPGSGHVDAGVSPRLVLESQSFEGRPLAPPSEIGERSFSQTDLRLAAFGRAAFTNASLRLFVELDAELSPGRLRHAIRLHPDLPVLPAWSAGLSLGVTWGEP